MSKKNRLFLIRIYSKDDDNNRDEFNENNQDMEEEFL